MLRETRFSVHNLPPSLTTLSVVHATCVAGTGASIGVDSVWYVAVVIHDKPTFMQCHLQ